MFTHLLTYEDLPETLPIFPLKEALLLPGGMLPLNIFEERYIRMVKDILSNHRMIGIIQSNQGNDILNIGCAGRIIQWSETEDGRYLIVLKGLNRFHVHEEINTTLSYRQIQANWTTYKDDMVEDCDPIEIDREAFFPLISDYLARHGMDCDIPTLDQSPCTTLLTAIPMICPFAPSEKQALLEAQTYEDRYQILMTLLKIAASDHSTSHA